MERRTFIKLGSSVCATTMVGLPQFLHAEDAGALASEQTTRLHTKAIKELGIVFPSQVISPPSGDDVVVTMKPEVIRRYSDNLYVHFEQQDSIQVFDKQGTLKGNILYPDLAYGVKDFAIDEELQLIYLLPRGKARIEVIDFQGDLVDSIGEFGIELVEQLNGPRSITLDANKRLHVLCAGSNQVKVFDNNGAYQFSYRASFARQPQRMRQLDGIEEIHISGGLLKERSWKFTIEGQAIY